MLTVLQDKENFDRDFKIGSSVKQTLRSLDKSVNKIHCFTGLQNCEMLTSTNMKDQSGAFPSEQTDLCSVDNTEKNLCAVTPSIHPEVAFPDEFLMYPHVKNGRTNVGMLYFTFDKR